MSFFATIAVIAILGIARSAQAAPAPALSPLAPTLAAFVAAEDDEEAEASEDGEFEFELCEDEDEADFCEAEEDGSERPQAPEECLLTRADASLSLAPNRDRLRLQVRYSMSSPAAVAIDYGLHGSKGSLFLGSERRQFGRQGVLRLTETLTEVKMEKAMAAKNFTVRLRVPAAPRYCQSLFDRQLDIRQATPSGLTWQQSE